MDQKNVRGGYLSVLMCLLSLLFIFGCSLQKEAKTLSPGEFVFQVNECKNSGGNPVPIYDKNDPIKVYRIECRR